MLTPKKQCFVNEYLRDLNGTQAAIRAGYSAPTANRAAARLMSEPEILAAIEEAKASRERRTNVDADFVLERLFQEAVADIADIYDDNNNLLPVDQWPLIWRQGLVQGIETDELWEGMGEDRRQIGVTRKIRLDSRIRRVELIGKHVRVNAFQDQVKMTGLDGLADRLARAAGRNQIVDAEPRVLPPPPKEISAAPPVDAPQRRSSRLGLASYPGESDRPRREPEGPLPPSSPHAADWHQPTPYEPIMPAREQRQAFADCDYASLANGLLASRDE
jgi:phage terminase small subunit